LTGTLIAPSVGGRHPAIVLVHGSGAENRAYMLPWARFLIRHGIAVLGYDKRGVGESTGDWNAATYEDLAGDAVAAVEYLKTRRDIDAAQIGLLGISQAGWIMPLAAVRSKDVAFLISISGAGVTPAETTIDQARNEMTMTGMPAATVADIVALIRLQYDFARTGNGWDAYAAAREKLVARMGPRQKQLFPARASIRNGKSSSERTFMIRCRRCASSQCRRSRCGASWTTTSWPTRTSRRGTRRSRPLAIATTRWS
jgi:pimeloyl-ACP methyl ester carboxylesterase